MRDRVCTDVLGDRVVLTAAVSEVIVWKHPETARFLGRVGRVLAEPDEVRRCRTDPRTLPYYRFEADVLGGKWLVVVVKPVDDRSFVSTVYATSKIKLGDRVWPK